MKDDIWFHAFKIFTYKELNRQQYFFNWIIQCTSLREFCPLAIQFFYMIQFGRINMKFPFEILHIIYWRFYQCALYGWIIIVELFVLNCYMKFIVVHCLLCYPKIYVCYIKMVQTWSKLLYGTQHSDWLIYLIGGCFLVWALLNQKKVCWLVQCRTKPKISLLLFTIFLIQIPIPMKIRYVFHECQFLTTGVPLRHQPLKCPGCYSYIHTCITYCIPSIWWQYLKNSRNSHVEILLGSAHDITCTLYYSYYLLIWQIVF